MVESDIEDDMRWHTLETKWKLWDEPWEQDEAFNREQFFESALQDLAKLEDLKNESPFRWSLEIDFEDGTHIGTVDTYMMDSDYRRVARQEISENQVYYYELGIAIFEPAYWNRGLGTQALTAYIQHHFENKHDEIYLETWSGNDRMVKSASRLGFFICEVQEHLRIVNGRTYDGLIFKLDVDRFLQHALKGWRPK